MEVRREEAQAAVSNQQNPGKVKFDKSLWGTQENMNILSIFHVYLTTLHTFLRMLFVKMSACLSSAQENQRADRTDILVQTWAMCLGGAAPP
jgi:hypothetical protein